MSKRHEVVELPTSGDYSAESGLVTRAGSLAGTYKTIVKDDNLDLGVMRDGDLHCLFSLTKS